MTDRKTTAVAKIVSGGQTGVDRGALDAAIFLGIEHGGWCPRGRLAEDGSVPLKYQLEELPSSKYWIRTEQNVVDSDATLILYQGKLSGGTEFTYRMTQKHGRPCLLVDVSQPPPDSEVSRWIEKHANAVLNVAGPRESSCPGIGELARAYLVTLLSALV